MDSRVLGPLEVYGPGGRIEIGSARRRGVLAVLLLRAGEVVSRDRLVMEVWGPDPPESAEHAVEVHVSALRSLLGRDLIQTRPPGYTVPVAARPVDLARFESNAREGMAALDAGDHVRAAATLRQALDLWRGDALEDLPGVAVAECVRLDTLREAVLERWLDAELDLGHHLDLLPVLRQSVATQPLREGLHERLAVALYRAGRQAEALETYRAARSMLVEQLGVEPGPALQAVEQAILRQDEAMAAPLRNRVSSRGVVSSTDARGEDSRSARHLPARLTSFIGREAALRELQELLEVNRLVTLTGPGGVGKTSLAMELARDVAQRFPDGAWFVPLETAGDPEEVPLAVTVALGLRDVPLDAARERLLENLAARTILLVIDSFEHVIDAAPLVTDILTEAPGVTAIATSRVPLLLTAEQLYPVQPLDLPDAEDSLTPASLGSLPAIRLFVDRARRVEPSFELTPANAAAIVDICDRMDGLPLGIELAAAQIGTLGPMELRERLKRRLPLPGQGLRDRPSRQKTLDGAIEWSYGLLDRPKRALLHRLAIFAGGATSEQIRAVCSAVDAQETEVDERLAVLVLNNLVAVAQRDDRTRYSLLETIRSFAIRRLPADETEPLRRRHAIAYLELAERTAAVLPGRGQADVLERLGEDRENLRSALRWAVDAGQIEFAQRFGAALWRYWAFRGELGEGRAALDAILAMPGDDEPTVTRARALEAAGSLAYWAADRPEMTRFYREQLRLAQSLDDGKLLADAWFNWSFTYSPSENTGPTLAIQAVDEAARRYLALGDERAHTRTLWQKGALMIDSGDAPAGRPIVEAAMERFRALDDLFYLGMSAGYISGSYLQEGNVPAAMGWGRMWLEISNELGDVATLVRLIEAAIDPLIAYGRVEEAVTLIGAHERALRRYGMASIRPGSGWVTEDPLVRARRERDGPAIDAALHRGQGMDLNATVEFLSGVIDSLLKS